MNKPTLFSLSSALVVALSFSAGEAAACKGDKTTAASKETPAAATPAAANPAKGEFPTLSVEALAVRMSGSSLMKDPKAVTVVDVNGAQTREKMGVIPGAVLLSSSSSFDMKVLPADKAASLVFYCSNERCSASKKAAKVASENGYSDVAVLPAGIAGWVDAGFKTTMPQS
ncbi:MAG: rhodanese-like domain-containing protein [Myxococcota bacterium]